MAKKKIQAESSENIVKESPETEVRPHEKRKHLNLLNINEMRQILQERISAFKLRNPNESKKDIQKHFIEKSKNKK
jgi:hypothetical protein